MHNFFKVLRPKRKKIIECKHYRFFFYRTVRCYFENGEKLDVKVFEEVTQKVDWVKKTVGESEIISTYDCVKIFLENINYYKTLTDDKFFPKNAVCGDIIKAKVVGDLKETDYECPYCFYIVEEE